ncbi:hypothetical protein EDF84_101854 [Erwinia rhapontici]|nr:hypothetical protein EDF84_101854 [Erwinia rhapontici]
MWIDLNLGLTWVLTLRRHSAALRKHSEPGRTARTAVRGRAGTGMCRHDHSVGERRLRRHPRSGRSASRKPGSPGWGRLPTLGRSARAAGKRNALDVDVDLALALALNHRANHPQRVDRKKGRPLRLAASLPPLIVKECNPTQKTFTRRYSLCYTL